MQNHEGFDVISNHFTSFVPFFALLDTFALFVAVTYYFFFVIVLLHVLGQSNVYLSYAFFGLLC